MIMLTLVFFGLTGYSVEAASDPSVFESIQKNPSSEEQSPVTTEIEERSLFSVLGSLVLYTLLIVGLIYGLIKFLAARQNALPASQVIRVLGASSVGQQKSVQVFQVGDQVLIVGVGENVTLLTEITDEQQKQKLVLSIKEDIHRTPFQQVFQTSLENQRKRLLEKKEEWMTRGDKT